MIHLQYNTPGWSDALRRLPDGSLIKLVHMVQTAAEVKAINPRLKVLLRHVNNTGYIWSLDWQANVTQAEREYRTYIDGTFAQYAHLVDYVEEPRNEYVDNSMDATQVAMRVMWARACAYVWKTVFQPQWPHIQALIGAQPVGNDIPLGFFKAAHDYGAGIATHAYVKFNDLGVRDPLDFRYHSGRWHDNDVTARTNGYAVPIAITETGPYDGTTWNGWRAGNVLGGNVQDYVDTMRDVIRDWSQTNAYQTGRLIGFNLFTTIQDGWTYYQTNQPELNALADMVWQEWRPGTQPVPVRVAGLDVSRWQGAINWQTAYNRGARFVFCKATEHTSWVDPNFMLYVTGAKAAGLLTGAYHFYKPTYDPVGQAHFFWSTVANSVELPLVLDVEDAANRPADFAIDVRMCLEELHLLSDRRPILYTSPSFYGSYLASANLDEVADLWIANWTTAAEPTIPDDYSEWYFWQYSSTGVGAEWGVSSARVDLDWFNGDMDALTAYAAGPGEPFPIYASVVSLMPPDANLWDEVLKWGWDHQETIAWSAHDCVKLATAGAAGLVRVWYAGAWPENIIAWLHGYGVQRIDLYPK